MTVINVNGTKLQPAIDGAQPGDTIAPTAGTYAGRLTVTKPLTFELGAAIIDGGQGDGFVNFDIAAKNVIVRDGDVRHAGCAFRFKGDCTGSLVERTSIPIVDWMVRNTVGGSDDNGGNAFQFPKGAKGVTVKGVQIRLCRAVSYDYKRDGGAFEFFVAENITIDGCETWDCVNVAEFGKNTADPPSKNIVIQNSIFHGRPNPGTSASDITVANGMYVRAVDGLTVRNNEFDRIDWWDIVLATQGGFAGPLANIVLDGNRARLLPGVNRWIAADAGVVNTTVKSDRNFLWPGVGTVLVEKAGTRYMTQATVVAATGWEANSYVGPEQVVPVPPVDPCAAVKAERDLAVAAVANLTGQLETVTAERDTVARKLAAARPLVAAAGEALA